MGTSSGCHDSVWVRLGKRSVETVELDNVEHRHCPVLDTMVVIDCSKCRNYKPDGDSGRCEPTDREWKFDELQSALEEEQAKNADLMDATELVIDHFYLETEHFLAKHDGISIPDDLVQRLAEARGDYYDGSNPEVLIAKKVNDEGLFSEQAIKQVACQLKLYFNSKGLPLGKLDRFVQAIVTGAARGSIDLLTLTQAVIGTMEASPENKLDRYGSIGEHLKKLAKEVNGGEE